MDRENIPDDVKRFIFENIPSVSFLEALLQLRAGGALGWDRDRLAKKIYVKEEVAEVLLVNMCAAGFSELISDMPPTYRYQPRSEELRSKIDKLAFIYSRHLVGVSRFIHANSNAHQ